jgi:hypothetical protein
MQTPRRAVAAPAAVAMSSALLLSACGRSGAGPDAARNKAVGTVKNQVG